MTMKKQIQHSLFILQIILLSACTLSMEEYIVKEEMKGVDEPHTEVTPFGEFTYQYRKNVLPLNGQPQEYIAMMNDSVIWFMDNIPTKWIPKEGQYIAANCSRTIPTGVHAKVRYVTKENGMIKVEFEPATQNEIFEHLTANIDFDYDVPNVNAEEDSAEIATRGIMVNDSLFIDMSLFDVMENPYTRADEKRDTTIKWSYTRDWDNFGVNATYSNTQRRRFHLYDNGKGYREEWTDTNEEITLAFDVEAGASKSKGYENCKTPNDVANMVNRIEEVLALPNFATMKDRSFKMKTRNICIPVPSTVFCVLINFDASAGWEIRGVVHAKYHHLTPTLRRGYIIDGKEKTPIEKEFASDLAFKENATMLWTKKQGLHHFGFSELYLGGSFDLWGRVRAGVGFIIGNPAAGAGLVVGLEGKVGCMGSVTTQYIYDEMEEYTIYDKEQYKIEPYIQLNAYINGIVNVMGSDIDMGGTTFNLLKTDWAMNPNAVVDPDLCSKSYKKGASYVDEITGEETYGIEIDANIGFKKLQTFFIYAEATAKWQWPCLRVYAENLQSKHFETVFYETVRTVETGKPYNFVFNTAELGLPDVDEYHIVPCIYDGYKRIVTEYRNNTMVLSKADPQIKETKVYPWYGRPLSKEEFDEYVKKNPMLRFFKHTDFVKYAFTSTVRVKNAANLTKWGLNFKVYDEGNTNKLFLDKDVDVVVGRGKTKSGRYSVVSSFIINHIPKNDSETPSIIVHPYFEYLENGREVRKDGAISKPYPLYYPYEREGGVYKVGTTEYVDIQ